MPRRLRRITHADQLTLVEHLDELRRRILVVIGAFLVALGFALWQNGRLIEVVNRPLPAGHKPLTLGVAEAFTATLTISAYAALVVTLPLVVHQAYSFVLPAFSPAERRAALPMLLMAPVLFLGGAVFGYFVVLPAAVRFLLGFNADQFNIQVRVSEYYTFVAMTLISIGALFQIPVGVLIATQVGVLTPRQLRENRRYAILAIAVVAMLLPGTDPMTMLISMAPLIVLFEGSILLALLLDRRRRSRDLSSAPSVAGRKDEPDRPVS